jgi:hypothetical protein
MAQPLGAQSKRVLAFIRDERAAGRPFPSAREITRHMGWKCESSAKDTLSRLRWHGLVVIAHREPSHRGWKYTYRLPGEAPESHPSPSRPL